MMGQKLAQSMLGFVLILLVGCSSAASTSASGLSSSESLPPTPSPLPATPQTIATAIPCAGPPVAPAEEYVLQIFTDNGGNYLAEGGILGDAGKPVNFDNSGKSKTAGFWRSIDNQEYTVKFSDSNDNPFATVGLQGQVQWDTTSCIISGAESFKWIQTANSDMVPINKSEVVQGHLVLTDEKGNKYDVLYLFFTFNGVMAKQ
jgi:hypothetical protein